MVVSVVVSFRYMSISVLYSVHLVGSELNIHITKLHGTTNTKFNQHLGCSLGCIHSACH
jgi:hypothetical protein